MSHGQELTEVKKAQIESFCVAGKSYTFIANHLHQSKRCIYNFVTKRLSALQWHKKSGCPKTQIQREERQTSRIP